MTEREFKRLRPRSVRVIARLKTDIRLTSQHIDICLDEGQDVIIYNKYRNKAVCCSMDCWYMPDGGIPAPIQWNAKIHHKHLQIIRAL